MSFRSSSISRASVLYGLIFVQHLLSIAPQGYQARQVSLKYKKLWQHLHRFYPLGFSMWTALPGSVQVSL